jgi:hypothetical protein
MHLDAILGAILDAKIHLVFIFARAIHDKCILCRAIHAQRPDLEEAIVPRNDFQAGFYAAPVLLC